MRESDRDLDELAPWTLSRRRLLQGGALGALGLAGAALLGCGDDDDDDDDGGGGGGGTPTPTATSEGATGTPPPAEAGAVKVGIAGDASSGDGAITSGGNWPIIAFVYNRLLSQSYATGEFVPNLAESWEPVDDQGLEWTFNLRQGVMFHDGSEFVAEDVSYTYERIQDPDVGATRAGLLAPRIESVDPVSDYSVRFKLTSPDVAWPSVVADDLMFPREYAARVGPEGFAANPVGTGPFTLKERAINDRIVLERFDDFWNTDTTLGVEYRPAISGAELRVLPESETRISALLAGEVDIITNVPSSAIDRLEGTEGVTLQYADTGQPLGIFINSNKPEGANGGPNPYSDYRVRQAMNYAINIQEIIDQVLTGHERPSTGVSPRALGLDTSLKPYPYDPDEARKLLEAAGYGDGISGDDAVIVNPSGRWSQSKDVCDAVAGYLRPVGIDATVREMEYAAASALLVDKNLYPMVFWGGSNSPETSKQAFYMWVDPVIGEYKTPEDLRTMYDEALATLDPAARGAKYAEMQDLFYEDAGHIFLYSALYTYATRGSWAWDPGNPTNGEVALWSVRPA